MILCFELFQGRLRRIHYEDGNGAALADALKRSVWIDVLEPSESEDKFINDTLGVDIPGLADMEEIESSSRLYREDDAAFMTGLFPAETETDEPKILPMSFILSEGRLITVRFHEPRALQTFSQRAIKTGAGCRDGFGVAALLLDATIDRIADILERVGQEVDGISKEIFRSANDSVRNRDYRSILQKVGRKGDLLSIIRDSLATLDRMFSFLGNVASEAGADKETRARIKTLSRDASSLVDHSTFLSQKVTFLLDATLGMINIEQSGIIKIFSVAAVIFLPPTLVASIYGMNFEFMPELGWTYGYPFAIGLMIVSAIIPYLFFKRKGWL